jgi:four helix bundle protein
MKEKIKDFRQLDVWNKSHQLTLRVYKITKNYPSDERFGLISQMRRSAFSVPANIAEGFARRGKAEKRQFLRISQGSANELLYYLILSKDLGYLKDIGKETQELESISKMLSTMIKRLNG